MIVAYKRTATGPRKRAGLDFPEGKWVVVENPPELLQNAIGFVSMAVTGKDDPKLANQEIYDNDAPPAADPERPGATEEDVIAYAEKNGLAYVTQKELDALTGERDRLRDDLTKSEQKVADKDADLVKAKEESPSAKDRERIALLERFRPNSKSEIGAQSLDNLKALAELNGVKVNGDDKAAYVAALSPK